MNLQLHWWPALFFIVNWLTLGLAKKREVYFTRIGCSVQLTCSEGDFYEWRKVDDAISLPSDRILTLNIQSQDQAGNYFCHGIGGFATTKKEYLVKVFLFLEEAPKQLLVAQPGQAMELDCTAVWFSKESTSPHEIQYKWTFRSELPAAGSYGNGNSNNNVPNQVGSPAMQRERLQLKPVTVHHSGRYHCFAHFGSEQIDRVFDLQVQEPTTEPVIREAEMDTVEAVPGETVRISCSVDSAKFIVKAIEWNKAKTEFSGRGFPGGQGHAFTRVPPAQVEVRRSGSVLVFQSIKVEDAGTYACFASTMNGRVQRISRVISVKGIDTEKQSGGNLTMYIVIPVAVISICVFVVLICVCNRRNESRRRMNRHMDRIGRCPNLYAGAKTMFQNGGGSFAPGSVVSSGNGNLYSDVSNANPCYPAAHVNSTLYSNDPSQNEVAPRQNTLYNSNSSGSSCLGMAYSSAPLMSLQGMMPPPPPPQQQPQPHQQHPINNFGPAAMHFNQQRQINFMT